MFIKENRFYKMNRYLKNKSSIEFTVVTTKPSNNAFAPSDFGPNLWYVLHTAAASASDPLLLTDQYNWKMILKGLSVLIPCSTCKQHYKKITSDINLNKIVSHKRSLFNFLIDVHNIINLRTNKPLFNHKKAKQLYDYNRGPGLKLFIKHDAKIFE